MVVTRSDLTYIPFTHITRAQVAELLGITTSTVTKYALTGKRNDDGEIIYLVRRKNGTYDSAEVSRFMAAAGLTPKI